MSPRLSKTSMSHSLLLPRLQIHHHHIQSIFNRYCREIDDIDDNEHRLVLDLPASRYSSSRLQSLTFAYPFLRKPTSAQFSLRSV